MKLPDWLENNIPTPRELEYITFRDGQYVFRGGNLFNTAAQAYDFARSLDDDPNFDFDDAARKAAGWGEDDFFYTDGNRVLPISTEQTQRWLIEESFKNSVERVHNWRRNKDDFRASYSMLDSHPAFWYKHDDVPTFQWVEGGFISDTFWFALSSEGMMMETGAHIAPDFKNRYHDLRLDTFGASFEDCIIQTAALVDKFFHSNGVERENVDYEKSKLELLLEERMREAGLTADE